jgi:hypothetical protein
MIIIIHHALTDSTGPIQLSTIMLLFILIPTGIIISHFRGESAFMAVAASESATHQPTLFIIMESAIIQDGMIPITDHHTTGVMIHFITAAGMYHQS